MGCYIEVPVTTGKAGYLIEHHGAVEPDMFLYPAPEGKMLVCVVQNALFDAAAVAFNEKEFMTFMRPDGRPKRWLLIDKEVVKELAPSYDIYIKEESEA